MRGALATSEAGANRGAKGAPKEGSPGDGSLILGRYRPLRPLGSGGTGSVWLARDERSACEVALKVVRREGKAASRAEREVDAAARLRHPRCLRALALDRDDEHVYVAYEYVRGRTLRDALRAGALDDRASVEAAAQVAEALAHAHSRGVVHRDVKPANLMLEEGDDVSVRVLDFGLARVDEADTLTAAGDVPGTLAYISPERLEGRPATPAADVWALGVLLWEALCGIHPFTAPSPVETARRIREGAKPLATLRPDLPVDLCSLVDRILALDPRRRPVGKRLPSALRDALAARARHARHASSLTSLRERGAHAALAGGLAGGAALLLPFFPRGWPLALALLTAAAALRAPRAGLALALTVPVLPLGNVSLGLALVYAALAAGWLALFLRDERNALLFLAGPLLAPAALLGLVPLVALRARDRIRAAALAAGGVFAAAVLAALADTPFPFAEAVPDELAVAGAERPDAVAHAAVAAFAADPALPIAALVFALAAVTAPLAREGTLWRIALWGSGFLAAAVLLPSATGAQVGGLALALGIWVATLILAADVLRRRALDG